MKRLVLRIVVGVVIVLVLALIVVWLMIDSIAKAGIEHGGTYALRTKTRVDDVDVSLLGGRLAVDDLTIDNPEGYTDEKLVETTHGEVDVKTRSLFTNTVVIPRIAFNGVTINVEAKEKTNNVSEVIENVKRLMKDEGEPSGRKLKIDTIVFTDVKGHVRLRGRTEPLLVAVDRIEFKDITSGDAKGVVTSELIRRLFPALIASVIQKGGAGLGALGGTLKDDVAGFAGEMGEGAINMVKQVPGIGMEIGVKALDAMKKAGKGAVGAAKDIGEGAKKAADDALKKAKDLLP